MEIRARYILMGAFTLGVIAAIFGFLYWMHATGGFRDQAEYRIQVENSVSGLLKGSPVLFNGIRVGEVTDLQLDARRPSRVMVAVAVTRNTPIRADTRIDIDFQGLTGVAFISMYGGTPNAPLPPAKDGSPVLVANTNGQTMGQAARDALHRLNTILDENSEGFHNTISNFSTFSDVLAKNSDRVDSILAGLERMTGGKKGAAGQQHDLRAASSFEGAAKSFKGSLVVNDPTALIALDTQNVLIRNGGEETPARWADNLPRLLQARVVQSFENAGFLGSVARPSDNATTDFQLVINVGDFHVTAKPKPKADVGITAKILDDGGKILAAKVFHRTQPAASAEETAAIAALNAAFVKLETDLVVWASNVLASQVVEEPKSEEPAPAEEPKSEELAPGEEQKSEELAPAEKKPAPAEAEAKDEAPPAEETAKAPPAGDGALPNNP